MTSSSIISTVSIFVILRNHYLLRLDVRTVRRPASKYYALVQVVHFVIVEWSAHKLESRGSFELPVTNIDRHVRAQYAQTDWIVGDNPKHTFPVEIPSVKKVDKLVTLIKETTKPEFDDLDADYLDIWKVSYFMLKV